MSSVWNFVKRHRGKLAVGGAVVGGTYIAHKYVTEHRTEIETWIRDSSLMQPSATDGDLQLQARKHFVFDSNQRTCDDAFLQLIPSIEQKLKELFNVEEIASRLQSGEITLKLDQVKQWECMKEESVVRIVCAMYSYAILMLAMKAQMCILASNIVHSKQHVQLSWTGQLMHKVLKFTGISSETSGSDGENAACQQLFLQSLQYFTTFGMHRMVERTKPLVQAVVSAVSLKQRLSEEKLKDFVRQLRLCIDTENFSEFVVPLQQVNGTGGTNAELNELLVQLKTVLDSENCDKLMGTLVDKMCSEFVNYSLERCPELKTEKQKDTENTACAVAKQIPVWTDFLNYMSTPDNILQPLIVSQAVHQFAVAVFEHEHTHHIIM